MVSTFARFGRSWRRRERGAAGIGAAAALGLTLGLACRPGAEETGGTQGAGTTGDTTGDTGDTGDTTTGGAAVCELPAGECFLYVSCMESPCELPCEPASSGCAGPELCALTVDHGWDNMTPSFAINPATCFLRALRDREAGIVTMSASGGYLDGSWTADAKIYLPGDGTAVEVSERLTIWAIGTTTEFTVSGALDLHPPAYYDACLADPTVEGLWPCLQAWHADTCVDFPGCM